MSDRANRPAPGGIDLPAVADALRRFGYDIEPASASDPPAASLVARRDGADRVILVAIDASGRFRIELTWRVGEWPSAQLVGAVPVRVVDSVTRAVTAAGTAPTTAQLLTVVASIDALAPWARRDDEAASNS
jgi:hypothetical protein